MTEKGSLEDPAEPITAGRRLRMVTCGDDTEAGNSKTGWVCAQDSDKQAAPAMALGLVWRMAGSLWVLE